MSNWLNYGDDCGRYWKLLNSLKKCILGANDILFYSSKGEAGCKCVKPLDMLLNQYQQMHGTHFATQLGSSVLRRSLPLATTQLVLRYREVVCHTTIFFYLFILSFSGARVTITSIDRRSVGSIFKVKQRPLTNKVGPLMADNLDQGWRTFIGDRTITTQYKKESLPASVCPFVCLNL